jgi:hypothetical protein
LAEQQLDNSLADCSKTRDPEKCQANLIKDTALETGVAAICDKLDNEEADSCFWKFAREQFEPEVCGYIGNNEKEQECFDSVYRALANRDTDLSWCEQIKSDLTRSRCVNTLSEEIARTSGCSGTRVDQAICDRIDAFDAAVASEDPDQCVALADQEDQVSCLDSVGSGDRDHDGLSANLETALGSSDTSLDSDSDGLSDADEYRIYKTDPSKADTDGDGYNDGSEIKNGYNPLGPGKL